MLSRVANTLYWMTRYVERADNLARLIDVNRQFLLDSERLDSARLRAFWQPIILSTGDEELFHSLYEEAGGNEVIRFLTDDPRIAGWARAESITGAVRVVELEPTGALEDA